MERNQRSLELCTLGACVVGISALVLSLLFSYKNLLVHPQVPFDLTPFFVSKGTQFHWNDWQLMFQLGEVGEDRPRFLCHYLLLLDTRLRSFFYRYFLIHPTLSIEWVFILLAGPILLYKLLRTYTDDKRVPIVGLIIYMSSLGFLHALSMRFMFGKALSNVVYILAIYLFRKIELSRKKDELFIRSSGGYQTAFFATALVGLFIDELPIFLFFILPVIFPTLFWGKSSFRSRVENALFFLIPLFAFVILLFVGLPLAKKWVPGYNFSLYWRNAPSSAVHLHAETGGGLFKNFLVAFGDQRVIDIKGVNFLKNLFAYFGTSIVPYWLSPMRSVPESQTCPMTQGTNFFQILFVSAFLGFLGVHGYRARKQNRLVSRLLLAAVIYIFLLNFMQAWHIPLTNGFYYGAPFAVLFALLIAMGYRDALTRSPTPHAYTRATLIGSLFVLFIAAVQISNFRVVNRGWIDCHAPLLEKSALLKSPWLLSGGKEVADAEQSLSRKELHAIWQAWKDDSLKEYIEHHPVSSLALYLPVELMASRK